MLVKFFARGQGRGAGPVDYLLGDRDHAGVLRDPPARQVDGPSPALMKALIDSLEFRTRYTSGVLSFQENDIDPETLRLVRRGFEDTLMPGLPADRRAVMWVEHREKGRIEQHFVIANLDLETGKRLQPWFARADKARVDAWKDVLNHDYGFSDPNAPKRRQLVTPTGHDIPDKPKAYKEWMGRMAEKAMAAGASDRDAIVQAILDRDPQLKVSRTTEKSVSFQHAKWPRAMRMTGSAFAADFAGATDSLADEREKSIAKRRSDYNAMMAKKEREIFERFLKPSRPRGRPKKSATPPAPSEPVRDPQPWRPVVRKNWVTVECDERSDVQPFRLSEKYAKFVAAQLNDLAIERIRVEQNGLRLQLAGGGEVRDYGGRVSGDAGLSAAEAMARLAAAKGWQSVVVSGDCRDLVKELLNAGFLPHQIAGQGDDNQRIRELVHDALIDNSVSALGSTPEASTKARGPRLRN